MKLWLGLWGLTPLSTIFQLYRGGQFDWWKKPEYAGRKPPTCHKSLTKHYYIMLNRLHLAMSGIRPDNVSGDRHRFHRQLYIQLLFDHDHDGLFLIFIVSCKAFNIHVHDVFVNFVKFYGPNLRRNQVMITGQQEKRQS